MMSPRSLPTANLLASSRKAGSVNIASVVVSDPGNAPDPATQVGSVDHEFRMGQFDITIGQYTLFLNAVAQFDPHGLYNPKMATDLMVAGIARMGSPGRFRYRVLPPSGLVQIPEATAAHRPITYVSWFDAARFANWMTNGQPSGRQTVKTTENGAYNLLSAQAK
jgi:formylglycine-generating enzyme required for sulfatase activity